MRTLRSTCSRAVSPSRWGLLPKQPTCFGDTSVVSVAHLRSKASLQVPGGSLASIKEQAYKTAVDVLHTYRSKCASASASGQLILPESLKLLPLYTLALTKTPAFRQDYNFEECSTNPCNQSWILRIVFGTCRSSTKADTRAAWLLRLLGIPPERTLPLMYPRLFALEELLSQPPQDPAQLALPPAINYLSASKLTDSGIFLLENGFEAFLQIGERVLPDLVVALIGNIPFLDSNKSQKKKLSRRTRASLAGIAAGYGLCLTRAVAASSTAVFCKKVNDRGRISQVHHRWLRRVQVHRSWKRLRAGRCMP